ncbi:hypothetical protein LI90_4327 (plasmid) [Carbonactinospora thermoautotrophica]|uniref:Uncharacterized protein n=1 Tax=Carbonactinospora thermoautotrophica TaxID=1469144 RepID=A0A132MHW3_9ACTN|nr:hypothetical protein [Carbonactinospora thermoautotrophica]KWW97355.1 hypothetical protein LI90_4327 [Carbonactinospora thermoautotrophica]
MTITNPLTLPEFVPTVHAPSPWGLRWAQPLVAGEPVTAVLGEDQIGRYFDAAGQPIQATDATKVGTETFPMSDQD